MLLAFLTTIEILLPWQQETCAIAELYESSLSWYLVYTFLATIRIIVPPGVSMATRELCHNSAMRKNCTFIFGTSVL